MKGFVLGSVITGTLRPEDLLPAFVDELDAMDWVRAAHTDLCKKARSFMETDDWEEDPEADELIDEIRYVLNEYAPPYTYFGAHPGDGADFGWWPDIDALTDARRYAVKVSIDGNEYELLADDGLLVSVNDHGNVSLYHLEVGESVWECV